MPRPLRLYSYSLKWQHFILALILVNTSGLIYALAIGVVYGFGIRLRGMCEVTPYMEATTASRGISQYTTLCSAVSVIYHGAAL